MKIFKNKSVFKKLIIVLLCVLLLSFCMPKTVSAKNDGIGGKLLSPVMDLLIGLGDGALNIVHSVIYNQNDTLITVDMTSTILSILATIAVGIVAAVIVGAAVVFTGGLAAAALSTIGISLSAVSVGTVIIASVTGGVVGAAVFNSNYLPDNLQLPIYSVSPEEIFSNEIGLFDVDFFNPNDDTEEKTYETTSYDKVGTGTNIDNLFSDNGLSTTSQNISWKQETASGDIVKEAFFKEGDNSYKVVEKRTNDTSSGTKPQFSVEYQLYKAKTETKTTEYNSIAYQLRPIISNWYTILRDISLVALLSVLVYIGIRIILSSTSNDKAKYKQMLVDWIVAICLLFVMQYIMAFSNLLVEKIVDIVKTTKNDKGYTAVIEDEDGKIEEALTEAEYDVSELKMNEDGKNYIQWKTNLLGIARLNAQMAKEESTSYAGHTVIFIVLVIFTVYFIFTYLKRVIYMAFLTLIAPLVALTYPIDKITDGKAQAFDSWLKEYIFNLLIQPMHLLLYTILVTSAFELAATNIIYSLVAIAFMMPAEKLLRKFFGFSKAETPGLLGGAAGAAIMMSGINKLLSKPKKGEKGSGSGGKEKTQNEDSSGIKYKDDIEDSDSRLFGDNVSQDNNDNLLGKTRQEGTNSINMSNSVGDNNLPKDKWDIPVEDRLADWKARTGESISGQYNQWKDDFSNTLLGQGVNKVKDGNRKIKNRVSNSKLGRTVRNSRTIQAGKEGIKFYGNGLKKKIEKNLNNSHPLKAVPKVVGGLATGAAAGTLGLAAGITSGDMSKAVQYTATGAAAGYAFGGSTTKNLANMFSVEGTEDAVLEAYYGKDEYKERKIKDNIERVRKDADKRSELAKRLGGEEAAEEALQEATAYSVRYGLEKANEIAAVYERHKAGEEWETAVSQVKYVNEFGKNTAKLGHKDSEDLNATIMDRVRKNSKEGTSEKEMQENARKIREKFDAASKVVYKKL